MKRKRKSLDLYHHCLHVQEVTSHFAQSLGLPEEEKLLLELAARFHDIGKVAIPDAILEKAARLTPQEFEVVKQYSAFGAQFLMQMGIPRQMEYYNEKRII